MSAAGKAARNAQGALAQPGAARGRAGALPDGPGRDRSCRRDRGVQAHRLGARPTGDGPARSRPRALGRACSRAWCARQREIDPLIDQQLAQGWRLARIDSIVRAILRAGAFELMEFRRAGPRRHQRVHRGGARLLRGRRAQGRQRRARQPRRQAARRRAARALMSFRASGPHEVRMTTASLDGRRASTDVEEPSCPRCRGRISGTMAEPTPGDCGAPTVPEDACVRTRLVAAVRGNACSTPRDGRRRCASGLRGGRAAPRIADVADPGMAAAGEYATRGFLAVPGLDSETIRSRGGLPRWVRPTAAPPCRDARLPDTSSARPLLDDAAAIHDGDAVGEMGDDRDVVRDEEIGDAEIVAQVGQQIDDRRLHRDVERRHRLVADDEPGPVASARAMPTRCFSPPLIWCG